MSSSQVVGHLTYSSAAFTFPNTVNTSCYQATFQENFGRQTNNIDIGRYVGKAYNAKSRLHGLSVYDSGSGKVRKQIRHSSSYVQYEVLPIHNSNALEEQQQQQRQQRQLAYQQERINTSAHSPIMPSQGQKSPILSASPKLCSSPFFPSKSSGSDKSRISVQNYSAYASLTPVSPNTCASNISGPSSPQGASLLCDVADPSMKKYRYNQTAMALQQSGLMKTTIKTAELLRKSRLLQQELIKLRRETTFFVHSVLNNPENKHLKDMYFGKGQSNSPTSQNC